jgi:hypothetical protein
MGTKDADGIEAETARSARVAACQVSEGSGEQIDYNNKEELVHEG